MALWLRRSFLNCREYRENLIFVYLEIPFAIANFLIGGMLRTDRCLAISCGSPVLPHEAN